MPRLARQKSYTDVYHIILRGINKQDIFFDDIDRWKFLKELKRCKEKYKFEIFAYCLMDNHVHLITEIEEIKELIFEEKFIKKHLQPFYNFKENYLEIKNKYNTL